MEATGKKQWVRNGRLSRVGTETTHSTNMSSKNSRRSSNDSRQNKAIEQQLAGSHVQPTLQILLDELVQKSG